MAEKAEGGRKPWVTVPVILVEKRGGIPNYHYKHGKAFMSNVDGGKENSGKGSSSCDLVAVLGLIKWYLLSFDGLMDK